MEKRAVRVKDAVVSRIIKIALVRFMKDFGRPVRFHINSHDKTVTLSVKLHGEPEPVKIIVTGYQITSLKGRSYLAIREVVTSKRWINEIARKYPEKLRFAIPRRLEGVARRVL
jgi:hypothetical protein